MFGYTLVPDRLLDALLAACPHCMATTRHQRAYDTGLLEGLTAPPLTGSLPAGQRTAPVDHTPHGSATTGGPVASDPQPQLSKVVVQACEYYAYGDPVDLSSNLAAAHRLMARGTSDGDICAAIAAGGRVGVG